METRLYVALTSREMADGMDFLRTMAGLPIGMKVGLELFVSRGPSLLEEIRDAGFPLFLDLKFHDIPYTVAGAVRSACRYAPSLLNIHASGGIEMMRAAADAVEGDARILAVTVLTSLSGGDLSLVGLRGDPAVLVARMAEAARDSGIHGVVCSPMEASAVREVTGPDFLIVTPGIRPAGSEKDDQKRTSTPLEAVRAGATALVVGRPVTMAREPRFAAESLLGEINLAFGER
jgi:orotidine-5'-phosphate decarboxylase